MTPAQALTIAEERALDLVEIAAAATPPVCRIMNSGKYFYQQGKREAEARKHQKHIQIKEVKFRPKIDEHDFQFKKRNAERFLLDGNKVKSTVVFRGREMVHSEIGYRILTRLANEIVDTASVESSPRQEGMTMVQILTPKKDVLAKQSKDKKEPAAKQKSDKAPKPKKPAASAQQAAQDNPGQES